MDLARNTWIKNMASCNAYIAKRDALATEPDGFQWLDTDKLMDGFAETYANLTSVGYANGWIG